MPEFKILSNIIARMETNGETYEMVTFSIDQELVNEINTKYQTTYTVDDLKIAANKCLAHSWIERISLDQMYTYLRITPKGIGAVRSKIKSEELKLSRTWLKKTSDYIEDHKGLFAVLGFLVASITLASKFFGIK